MGTEPRCFPDEFSELLRFWMLRCSAAQVRSGRGCCSLRNGYGAAASALTPAEPLAMRGARISEPARVRKFACCPGLRLLTESVAARYCTLVQVRARAP